METRRGWISNSRHIWKSGYDLDEFSLFARACWDGCRIRMGRFYCAERSCVPPNDVF